jgi:hypothetical protein
MPWIILTPSDDFDFSSYRFLQPFNNRQVNHNPQTNADAIHQCGERIKGFARKMNVIPLKDLGKHPKQKGASGGDNPRPENSKMLPQRYLQQ